MDRKQVQRVVFDLNAVIGTISNHYERRLPVAIQATMKDLRKLTDLLKDAWSEMVWRNLMTDIVRDLERLKLGFGTPPVKQDLQNLCSKCSQLVRKALATHDPTRSRYKHVVCLGYRVKTAGDTYSGEVDDWDDMKVKCDSMIAAIRSAFALAAQNNYNTDPDMLKIFMAPEFFFRGRNGAYDFDDVNGVRGRNAEPGIQEVIQKAGIVDLMLPEIVKPAYKDWLFVLGTAIAANKFTRTVCNCNAPVRFVLNRNTGKTDPVCTVDSNHVGTKVVDGATVENVAFVVKEGHVHEVKKELVSKIDYKSLGRPDNEVTVRGENLTVMRKKRGLNDRTLSADPHPLKPKFDDERMGGSVFNMDGITFGLEICLDHFITWQVAQTGKGRLENAANIQIQLIPSAGMSIGKLRTVTNGIVFNVDGVTPHVQVVGRPLGLNDNDPIVEIHHDLVDDSDNQWQFAMDKNFGQIGDVDYFSNPNEWNNITNSALKDWAPKIINGPEGSVLMYGPYVIPKVS